LPRLRARDRGLYVLGLNKNPPDADWTFADFVKTREVATTDGQGYWAYAASIQIAYELGMIDIAAELAKVHVAAPLRNVKGAWPKLREPRLQVELCSRTDFGSCSIAVG